MDPFQKAEETINKYICLNVAIELSKNYFIQYVKEHRVLVASELLTSGKYVIKSPYGLTATITAEKKEDNANDAGSASRAEENKVS